MIRGAERHQDLISANRYGQQLFFADMFRLSTRTGPHPQTASAATSASPDRAWPVDLSSIPGQLTLFPMRRDLAAHGRAGLHLRADPAQASALDDHARELAGRFGWSAGQVEGTYYGIRIVLGIQDHPDRPVNATDVEQLRDIDLPVWTVLEVFAHAGLLHDDRAPALESWFARQTSDLPEPMAGELAAWFQVMKHGSHTPPRRRPRSPDTITVQLRWALPTLRVWAAAGHTTLRDITRDDVLDALPASGNPRSQAGQGLKSIFRLLKAQKVLFLDPTARIKTGYHESRQPLPADLNAIRDALNSPHPARALVVALIAFHGLRTRHLQRLHLTDIRDGRLYLDGRTIVLADPVRQRLTAWLDHRQTRWPNTTNPHLFIHYRTAARTDPVGRRWLRLAVGTDLTPRRIREDRYLNEAHATGGDPRRLADLFGLSIQAGTRYTNTLNHTDLRDGKLHLADP